MNLELDREDLFHYTGTGFGYTIEGNLVKLVMNEKIRKFFSAFAIKMKPEDVELTYDAERDELSVVVAVFGHRITTIGKRC